MKIAIFAYSRQGCSTACRVQKFFSREQVCCYTVERFRDSGFSMIESPADAFYGSLFKDCQILVFIGSCGIAVRQIAPYVKSKQTDPAVLVIDELASFVIPLLSGHIGGANHWAVKLSEALRATPVVTTATDIHHKFSVDAWAVKNGYRISSLSYAKAVSAQILERDIPLVSDFPVVTDCPPGVTLGQWGDVGICISYRETEPFEKTLRLIPPILHLGIGCRKGTSADAIENAVFLVLKEHHIDIRAIKCAASIDLKAHEQGLLEFCRSHALPVAFYSAEALSQVQGDFTASRFVSQVTGVDNVCERAAQMGADQLIVKKTARNGVTVALAAENLEVKFG